MNPPKDFTPGLSPESGANGEPPAGGRLEAADGRSARGVWRAVLVRLGPLLGLACVVALFGFLRPATFLTAGNFQIMLLQTAVVATAALGMTLVIISGGIDLSIGSNIALCTVVVALLLGKGAPPWVAVLGGVATGAACGALIGTLVTRLRLTPFIVTLGTWGALRGLAKGLAHETMVNAPTTWINGLLQSLRPAQRWMLFPPGVWLMLVLTGLVAALLRYTRFGRHVFALGSNEQTARLCGVPVELAVIAAVVIGGASLHGGEGSVLGALVGALIMTVVANGCTKLNLANWVQEIVTGAIIVSAVALERVRNRGEG